MVKDFLKAQLKWLVPLAIAAVILLILEIENQERQQMSLEIHSTEVDYVVCYSRGLGPRRLDYLEHKDLIDSLFEMLSGEYRFAGSWSNRGRSGGGPYAIHLYNREGDLLETVLYMHNYVCVPTRSRGKYYLYRQEGREIQFDGLEEALDLYGKYSR